MKDRRKGPDTLVKWVKWSGIISWIIVSIILIITMLAKPGFESYLDESFHVKLQNNWDIHLISYILPLLVLLFCFCMISIGINLTRCRRKSDKFNKTLIFNASASFVGILLYLFFLV